MPCAVAEMASSVALSCASETTFRFLMASLVGGAAGVLFFDPLAPVVVGRAAFVGALPFFAVVFFFVAIGASESLRARIEADAAHTRLPMSSADLWRSLDSRRGLVDDVVTTGASSSVCRSGTTAAVRSGLTRGQRLGSSRPMLSATAGLVLVFALLAGDPPAAPKGPTTEKRKPTPAAQVFTEQEPSQEVETAEKQPVVGAPATDAGVSRASTVDTKPPADGGPSQSRADPAKRDAGVNDSAAKPAALDAGSIADAKEPARPDLDVKAPMPTVVDADPTDSQLVREGVTTHRADAGAPSATEAAPPPVGVPVTYHGTTAPLVFHLPVATRSAVERARRATRALEAVLDDEISADEADLIRVSIENELAVVRIKDTLIAEFTLADAQHAALSLEQLAERTESDLRAFVPSQIRRRALQFFVLHIFISVFVVVIGVLAVRTLRSAFDKWDAAFDDKRGSLEPITVFRIPVVSSAALGGALTFGLFFGRIISYVASVIAVVATVFSQFDTTRPLLERLFRFTSAPILRGFEAVIGALPGLVLALLLVLGTLGLLRVASRLLDGVAESKIRWRRVPPERVPVARIGVAWIAFLLALPLVIAAAFGRFGTPIESIALLFTASLALAAVPLLASSAAGLFVLWTRFVRPGDWITCGAITGEVTSLSMNEIRLVPADGGSASLAPLAVLFSPIVRHTRPPSTRIALTLKRDSNAEALLTRLADAMRTIDTALSVEFVGVDGTRVLVEIEIPRTQSSLRTKILLTVVALAEKGDIVLFDSAES
jgi:small-conductance mechanosensitive channel